MKSVQEKIYIVAIGLNEGVQEVLKKYFSKSEFLFSNFNLTFKEKAEEGDACDCILVNSDIKAEEIKSIKHSHPSVHIFYIPTFDASKPEEMNGIDKLISEPFKLSELEKSLKDIYERKMFVRS